MRSIRRTVVAAAVAGAVVLTACGDGATTDDPTPGGGPTGAAPTADQPSDEVLRMVIGAEPAGLEPMTGFVVDGVVAIAIVERLIDVDQELRPIEGGLIDSWEQVDPLTWRMSVRNDVAFHNGAAFDASAAARALELHRDTPGRLQAFFSRLTEVTVLDETTIEITTQAPNNSVPALVSTAYALEPGHFEEVGPEGYAEEPVGTGPYMFDSWTKGQRISAVRFDDYWRGTPRLAGVEWTFASEGSTRAALLQTGDVHIAQSIPTTEQGAVEAAPGIQMHRLVSGSIMGLQLATNHAPLDDIRVREAIARAIDRQAIVDAIFAGVGAEAHDGWYPPFFGTGITSDFPYSPDVAADLITEANPGPLELVYTVGRYPNDGEVAEALAGMLESIGMTVTRNPVDGGQFFPTKNVESPGRDAAFMFAWVPVFPHPDVLFGAFVSDNASTKHYCPASEYQELGNAALAAETVEEMTQGYGLVEERVLNEDICFVPMYIQVLPFGIAENVSGFEPRPDDLLDYSTLGLD